MACVPTQRTLTIYLVNAAIADAQAIVRPGLRHHVVTVNGQHIGDLFVKVGHPHTPPWVTFFNDAVADLTAVRSMSTSAVLLIQTGGRYFAIVFGFGRMLLYPSTTDDRFGLKVTLNAVDPTKIRSIDRETLDSPAPHSQIQARVAANITEFGLDVDQDLLRAVTGIPRDKTLGKRLTGKDALRTTGPFTLDALPALLRRYLAESEKTSYREEFPWLDHIQEVKNPELRRSLDEIVEAKLQRRDFDGMWLSVPERIEWQNVDGFTYRKSGTAQQHPDIHLRTFVDSLRDPTSVTIEAIRHRYRIYANSDNEDIVYEWPVYQCLYAEIEHTAKQYLLNNSTWYLVDSAFRDRVENSFRRLPKNKCALPNAQQDEIERVYNKRVADSDNDFALMDRKLIRYPDPRSPIEFCDLYSTAREIIHVKPYAGSSTLSHLFAQGVTSAMLFAHDAGFRFAVTNKLPTTHQISNPQQPLISKTYSVVYAIISGSQNVLTIPFFSKVTLQGAAKTLRSIGYNVQLTKIGIDA
jgi:uncharacterized protein (TIGR04141 family)